MFAGSFLFKRFAYLFTHDIKIISRGESMATTANIIKTTIVLHRRQQDLGLNTKEHLLYIRKKCYQ